MRSRVFLAMLGVCIVALTNACEVDPFNPPTHRPSGASGAGGGAWGSGGAGGMAGVGNGGTGGAPCVCDGADDGKECTNDLVGECPGGDIGACHPVNLGVVCSSGWCDADGLCKPCVGCTTPECSSRCDGVACTNDFECHSQDCRAEYCRLAVGQACVDDVQCGTFLCDPIEKICKSCTGMNPCSSGSICDNVLGTCKAALGEPASADSECTAGKASGFLCALAMGSSCAQHWECESRNCVNNVCAGFCQTSNECAAATQCFNGSCKLLTGSYCIVNTLCESGVCTGFPRKCL